MRVLNLYAGLGGNRDKWKDCDVTAVEFNQSIADFYKKRFPKDKVIIGDAHAFLLAHYKEFDFIWSSPPCQTHSRTNYFLRGKGIIRYPDFRLYEEIIFLKLNFKGKWAVENVIPYYPVLVSPKAKLNRHLIWSNFEIPPRKFPKISLGRMWGKHQKAHSIPLAQRNALNPRIGKYILDCARRSK